MRFDLSDMPGDVVVRPENFIKSGEVDVTEFKEEAEPCSSVKMATLAALAAKMST